MHGLSGTERNRCDPSAYPAAGCEDTERAINGFMRKNGSYLLQAIESHINRSQKDLDASSVAGGASRLQRELLERSRPHEIHPPSI